VSLNELERSCLAAATRDQEGVILSGEGVDSWIRFGFGLLLESGRQVRAARLATFDGVDFKGDGSPVTNLESSVEETVSARLREFAPDAVLVGEESGGKLPDTGFAVAVDPIDGTWAFLGRTENIATSLAVFRDGTPFLGMVSNPATGEIAYATSAGSTRNVQLSAFGEGNNAETLPLSASEEGPVLVNVHPGRSGAPLIDCLYEAWASGHVRMVRSPGGSPAWALLDAAKGSFIYVNLWSKRPAEAFDLAAGCLLVQGAGGEVAGLDGSPIDPVSHAGPFVAGVNEDHRRLVIDLVRGGLNAAPGE
jgi:fructose-1,6-bisphosphatase/inositol monophosphatase family enzyme